MYLKKNAQNLMFSQNPWKQKNLTRRFRNAVCVSVSWKCTMSLSSVDSECGPWIMVLLLVLTAVWLGRFHSCVGIRSWNIDLTACNIDEQLKLFISRHSAFSSEDLKGKNQTIYEFFTLVCFLFSFFRREIWEIVWDSFKHLAESII